MCRVTLLRLTMEERKIELMHMAPSQTKWLDSGYLGSTCAMMAASLLKQVSVRPSGLQLSKRYLVVLMYGQATAIFVHSTLSLCTYGLEYLQHSLYQ